jgi:hypothetical protein
MHYFADQDSVIAGAYPVDYLAFEARKNALQHGRSSLTGTPIHTIKTAFWKRREVDGERSLILSQNVHGKKRTRQKDRVCRRANINTDQDQGWI